MIVVLSGGVGAARFLLGLSETVAPSSITAIVNTGDDLEWNTLHVSPDIDTVTYTLARANAETGWGLEGESWSVIDALGRYGASTWFGIGDRDLATHLYRTEGLSGGRTLSEVTRAITAAWGVEVAIVPMTDDRVRTKLIVDGDEEIDFQEYFVHRHHEVAVSSVRFEGIEEALPAPGVLQTLEEAEAIIIAPSNPIVSIGPILAFPGIAEVLHRRRDRVAAISPIIGGRALKGPADRLLRELGHESSATGVARLLTDCCATMIIDDEDQAEAETIRRLGYAVVVTNTVMTETAARTELALTTLRALGIGNDQGER